MFLALFLNPFLLPSWDKALSKGTSHAVGPHNRHQWTWSCVSTSLTTEPQENAAVSRCSLIGKLERQERELCFLLFGGT